MLVLCYMCDQKKFNLEVEVKVFSYINQGWQCLLIFEVEGGGFFWFGS